jgi:hypothetical protein
MAASSSKGITVYLSKGSATAAEQTISAITAAKPAVLTLASTAGFVKGDVVKIMGTGIPKLDGKIFTVGAVVGAATNTIELVGSDLTGVTIPPLTATAKAQHWNATDMVTLCLSTLGINAETPGTVSVGTFCDPSASIPSVVTQAGTMTLGGYIDNTDLGYAELLLAEIDNKSRILDIKLPGSLGSIVAEVTIGSVIYDLPIDGGLAFSASAALATKPVHRF